MAKKAAARPKNGVLQTRPADEQWAELIAYCLEHDLSLSEIARLGILRALKKPPTGPERQAIERPIGNPDPASAGRAGAAARWGKKRTKKPE